jgi:hypothetical protein
LLLLETFNTSGSQRNSDIVAVGEFPEALRKIKAWTSCLSGAIPLHAYAEKLQQAGFATVEVVDSAVWRPSVLSVKVKATKSQT